MSLEHILLGLMRNPRSGYSVKSHVDNRIRHFWPAELSQIYPTLQRMEKRGWLTSRAEASIRGPERRVYETTAEGRERLRAWLESGPRLDAERFAYLGQVTFLDELGPPARRLEFMEALQARLTARLDELQAIETAWGAGQPRFPDSLDDEDFHTYLTLRMGLHTAAAQVAWCAESLGRLRARQRP